MTEKPPNDQLFEEGLMTVAEASKFLRVGKSMLYDLMESGQLVYVKIGRARRIPKRALIDLAKANLRGGWKHQPGHGTPPALGHEGPEDDT